MNPSLWDIEWVGLDIAPATRGARRLTDGSCASLDEGTCEASGGTFQGLGTSCATVTCEPVSGACCFADDSCANGLLAAGGCPSGFVVAGSFLVLATRPGRVCLGASSGGRQVTAECLPERVDHAVDWIGLDFGGGPCLDSLPCRIVVPLESRSWGQIKALYR